MSGNTRDEALVRARNALDSFVIEGIHTTISFLSEITRDRAFSEGHVDTGFVDRFQADRSGD